MMMRSRGREVLLKYARRRVRGFHFVSGSSELTAPLKEECEDTHFYHARGIGVFDGVGSWSDSGVSPRNFSELVCQHSLRNLRDSSTLEPTKILHNAWMQSKHETGASTALLCTLQNNTVDISNVGDSQILHVREGQILWRSVPQHHKFNCPFQIGSHSRDEPLKIAKETRLRVRKDDIFIAASDGLFDNLTDEEILHSVESVPCTNLRTSRDGEFMSYDRLNSGSFLFKLGRSQMNAQYVGYLVGRDDSCDSVWSGQKVSSKHCVLSFHDPNIVTVTDISSEHGTYLNGERLPVGMPAVLSSEDILTLGTPCADEAREQNLPVFECGSDNSVERCSFDVYKGHGNILTRKAEWLSSRALRVSLDKDAITPFSTHAAEHFGSKVSGRGGKMDDITVVIARVTDKTGVSKSFRSKRLHGPEKRVNEEKINRKKVSEKKKRVALS